MRTSSTAYREYIASTVEVPALVFTPLHGTGKVLQALRGLLYTQRGVRNVRDGNLNQSNGELRFPFITGEQNEEKASGQRCKVCLLQPSLLVGNEENFSRSSPVVLRPLKQLQSLLPDAVFKRLDILVSGSCSTSTIPSQLMKKSRSSQQDTTDWAFGVTSVSIQLTYENYTMPELLRMVLDHEEMTRPSAGDDVAGEMVALSGFEQVGHIAHVNLSARHLPYEETIGQVILDCNSSVDVVVNKVDSISSVFREFKMKIIGYRYGSLEEVETFPEAKINELLLGTVRQHGCNFRVPYNLVYWNTRLCHEHTRLVDSMKSNDMLFDVMAGVGPFAVPAAKKGITVIANDLNPVAAEYMRINAALNHTQIQCFNLDGREFMNTILYESVMKSPTSDSSAGRRHVTMNLPAIAVEFLDVFSPSSAQSPWQYRLVPAANPSSLVSSWTVDRNVLIHVYCFSAAVDVLHDAVQQVERHLGYSLEAKNKEAVVMVRDVAPTKRMVCVSFTLPDAFWERQVPLAGESEEQRYKVFRSE